MENLLAFRTETTDTSAPISENPAAEIYLARRLHRAGFVRTLCKVTRVTRSAR
jgi:hypothetical protein